MINNDSLYFITSTNFGQINRDVQSETGNAPPDNIFPVSASKVGDQVRGRNGGHKLGYHWPHFVARIGEILGNVVVGLLDQCALDDVARRLLVDALAESERYPLAPPTHLAGDDVMFPRGDGMRPSVPTHIAGV